MRRSTFMAIGALIAFAFGLAFIVVPAQLMALYGVALDTAGQLMGRYFGSAFLGIGVLTWLGRNAPQGDALRAIMMGNFILSITGLAVGVLAALSGLGNALLWSDVAIYLLMTAGWVFFLFGGPRRS